MGVLLNGSSILLEVDSVAILSIKHFVGYRSIGMIR